MKGSIASLQPEPEDAAPSGSQTQLQNEKEETASTTSVLAENQQELEHCAGAIQRVDSGSNYPTDTSPTLPPSVPTTITTRSADEQRDILNESKLQKSTNGLVRLHALTMMEPIDPPPTTTPLRLVTDGILRIPNNWLHQGSQDLNVLAENERSPRLMA